MSGPGQVSGLGSSPRVPGAGRHRHGLPGGTGPLQFTRPVHTSPTSRPNTDPEHRPHRPACTAGPLLPSVSAGGLVCVGASTEQRHSRHLQASFRGGGGMGGWGDGWMDGWAAGWGARWVGGWMDGQTVSRRDGLCLLQQLRRATTSQGHGVCRQWPGTQSARLIKALHSLERRALSLLRSGPMIRKCEEPLRLPRPRPLTVVLAALSPRCPLLGDGVAAVHRRSTVAVCETQNE